MSHIHGGNAEYYFKKFNLNESDFIDFSVNLNPFGMPEIIRKKWDGLYKQANKYPSESGERVIDFYKKRFSIKHNSVIAGNGSIELIYMLPRALNIRDAAILEPSFYDYKRAFTINNCNLHTITLREENGFKFTVDKDTLNKIEKSDALMLANPNNPTGKIMNKGTITALAKRFPDKWFLIDEAFIQFSSNCKEVSLMDYGIENIVVIHSLTKFYAVAGLRIGAAIGPKNAIDKLKYVKQPWSVNSIAEATVGYLTNCLDYEKKTTAFIDMEKERIKNEITTSKNIKLFETDANFFLSKWLGRDFDDFLKYLLKKGIYVRDCRNFSGLSGNFFRFAILKKEKNNKLIETILRYE